MAYQKQIYENTWFDTYHSYDVPKMKLLTKLISQMQYSTAISLGCGDGMLSSKTTDYNFLIGIDSSDTMTRLAKEKLNHIILADLETSIPIRPDTVDLCTAIDLIEHIIDTDNLLLEVNRILNSSGKMVLVTPNLASFTERILLLIGFQPQNIEVSRIQKFGSIRKTPPVGHLRGFTWGALREMLKYHGFEIQKFQVTTYYTGFLKLMDLFLGRVRRTLASLFVLVCIKTQDRKLYK